MSNIFEQVMEKYRECIVRGDSIEEVVIGLHSDGLTITESIKAVRELYHLTLGDAKKRVAEHPVWIRVVQASIPLHDDLEKLAE